MLLEDELEEGSAEAGTGSLAGLSFCVFGLGNTQYEQYNSMGRRTNKRLAALGGRRVYRYGEGDDNASLEEDFAAWREEGWSYQGAMSDGQAPSRSPGPKYPPSPPALLRGGGPRPGSCPAPPWR